MESFKATAIQDNHQTPTIAKDGDTEFSHTERSSDGILPHPHGAMKRDDEDTALNLFRDSSQLHERLDPAEERRLVRKIDFRILPYLAVCYCFFYIDKTTLSYAAIFGIEDDLKLHGTQYNWLSSLFYFGFLVWALPTNFLLQRLPVCYSYFVLIPWCEVRVLIVGSNTAGW